jgi:undecaprenyl-diphosphatase
VALLWYFRADWVRIISGFVRSIRRSVHQRRLSIDGRDERLAWMIVIATIPVGLTGVALEHAFRTIFAKPTAAAVFLLVNGLVLFGGERLRRRQSANAALMTASARVGDPVPVAARAGGRQRADIGAARDADERIARLSFRDALYVGTLQIAALFAGISRSGTTIVGGLWRGLDHEDAARFGFLLATPAILAAGLLKLPSLAGSAGAHIHGQIAVGVVVAGVAAYFSVRFLMRYFQTRTLTPFAVYCVVVGIASIFRFG